MGLNVPTGSVIPVRLILDLQNF